MKKQRRKHAAEFKARAALEAIRGLKTVSEIAAEYESHPVMVGNWKKDMLANLPELFHDKKTKTNKRPRPGLGRGNLYPDAPKVHVFLCNHRLVFRQVVGWELSTTLDVGF